MIDIDNIDIHEEAEHKGNVMNILNKIRLFQFDEKEVIEEMAKNVILKRAKKGEVLFGYDVDSDRYINDSNILVVVKGQVEISLETIDKEHRRDLLSVLQEGQTVTSILSILEALITSYSEDIFDNSMISHETVPSIEKKPSFSDSPNVRRLGHIKYWNNDMRKKEDDLLSFDDHDEHVTEHDIDKELITARAKKDTLLAEIPLKIFYLLQEKYPKSILRLARSIVMRLQRVTLLTVNKYFGITRQLINTYEPSTNPYMRQHCFKAREQTFKSKDTQLAYDFEIAFKGLSKLLNLDEECKVILRQHLEIERHSVGSIVMAPRNPFVSMGEDYDADYDVFEPCLYYVIRGGGLDVYLHNDDDFSKDDEKELELVNLEEHLLYQTGPGEIVGQLAVITGDFYYRVIAAPPKSVPLNQSSSGEQPVVLGKLRKEIFDRLVAANPSVMYRTIFMIYLQLSPSVQLIDYALDWEHCEAGETLCVQNENTDGMYVVLSGRLRAVRQVSGKEKNQHEENQHRDLFGVRDTHLHGKFVAEYGKGDSFGALEALTEVPLSFSVVAVRDTELAKISHNLFKFFFRKYPQVVVRFGKIIGESLQKHMHTYEKPEEKPNISTIAVFGVDKSVPLRTFCNRLAEELKRISPTLHLDQSLALQRAGSSQETQLIRWLGEMEDIYKIVLYECDNYLSQWTKRCLRQADCILIVGWSESNHDISPFERYLLKNSKQIAARKELVLLHRPEAKYPTNSLHWLTLRRGWCSAYHHVMVTKEDGMDVILDDSLDSFKINLRKSQGAFSNYSRMKRTDSLRDKYINPIPSLIKRGADSIWKKISKPKKSGEFSLLFPLSFSPFD